MPSPNAGTAAVATSSPKANSPQTCNPIYPQSGHVASVPSASKSVMKPALSPMSRSTLSSTSSALMRLICGGKSMCSWVSKSREIGRRNCMCLGVCRLWTSLLLGVLRHLRKVMGPRRIFMILRRECKRRLGSTISRPREMD